MIEHAFAGIKYFEGQVIIEPQIPRSWRRLSFQQRFRDSWLSFTFQNSKLTLEADQDICVVVQENRIHLTAGRAVQVVLNPRF
ncbi:glycosyl hydrolase family 65 protein [Lapidilactobacillus luobeiensis]|uniref:glycosyl hydrolase family 65 protein n=1 Tax=Lapidilactobacillus luobeiensis TaxID=2950371 RepID=UPI0021C3989A|nr:glycosyl hydrolase family 65 protein [Lapidilactobacillus luobeiensis]